ncbi:MAG: hypothetical protein ABFS45_23995 [Pseudomonadota bacterium]
MAVFNNFLPLKMEISTLLESKFHYDGRGPELQRVVWAYDGKILQGFEYYNPEDAYEEESIKCLELVGVEAYSMAVEEVHNHTLATGESKASIFKIESSPWMKQYDPECIEGCSHYQIIFYDEVYDVICKEIKAGYGRLLNSGS